MKPEYLIAISLVGSFSLGLVGKIIFDWLKIKRIDGERVDKRAVCTAEFNNIKTDVANLNDKVDSVDHCLAQEKIKVAGIASIIQEHEKRLDRGVENFSAIRSDIGAINENIAILLERSTRKREDFQGRDN